MKNKLTLLLHDAMLAQHAVGNIAHTNCDAFTHESETAHGLSVHGL